MAKVLAVVGTRPEATKMAPVILALRRREPSLQVKVALTGQHREMGRQGLAVFGLTPDHDLDIMEPKQALAETFCRAMMGLVRLYREERPDLVLVQGDTVSCLAGALGAFYERIPVGHVEAGLRTGDPCNPFPEEVNRKAVATATTLHFAPTVRAQQALLQEGYPASNVFLTGNTAVDAVQMLAQRQQEPEPAAKSALEACAGHKMVLVELHRRENWGEPLRSLCRALRRLVSEQKEAFVVFSVHPNPVVGEMVRGELGAVERVLLLTPPDYPSFLRLMKECYFILTDSGGIQEEAPSLRKPVLVARVRTERPEGVEAGLARLVGTNEGEVLNALRQLLKDRATYEAMTKGVNPYGDGRAGERIAQVVEYRLGLRAGPPEQFHPGEMT